MQKIILIALLTTSTAAFAEWKHETETNFKGDKITYLSKRASNGAEIIMDMQQKHIVFEQKGKVLNQVEGIKIDGKYYDASGASIGDSRDSVAFCASYLKYGSDYEALQKECFEAALNASTIEVNIDYFRSGVKSTIFHIKKGEPKLKM